MQQTVNANRVQSLQTPDNDWMVQTKYNRCTKFISTFMHFIYTTRCQLCSNFGGTE